MDDLYFLEVALDRQVKAPQFGPDAYTSCYIRKVFSYGKGKFFPSSKEGEVRLTEALKPWLDKASSISIIVFRGYGGTCRYLKQTDEKFFSPFSSTERAEFQDILEPRLMGDMISVDECADCRKPIHPEDDDARVCIECGGRNRRKE